jgi:hypothetical protein
MQPSVYVISSKIRQLLLRFKTEFFRSFPDIPCAYCGILCIPRSVVWQRYDGNIAPQYQLQSVLGIALTFNLHGSIAICKCCSRSPRETLNVGPWPQVLFDIPQMWRRLLSPIELHCSLGRTQSQSATGFHNPFSTYRTLKGTLRIL